GAFHALATADDITGGAQNLSSFLGSLSGTGYGQTDSNGQTGQDILQSLLDSSAFSFPIIQSPLDAFNLLLGGDVDLFDAALPQLSLPIGPGFDANGNPTGPLVDLVSVPIIFPGLNFVISADFQAAMNIAFGYDSRGLEQFAASGYTDPTKIIDGLFVTNNIHGQVEPVVQLEALLQLGLELGVPGAEVGGGGNIAGTIDFDLNGALNGTASGPVKLYLDQIASAL